MITGKLLLYTYHKETKKGYPIKIIITNGVTKQKKPFHLKLFSSKEDWDENRLEPKPSHHDYDYVLTEVLEHKLLLLTALKKANRKNWSIDETIDFISGKDPDNIDFFIYADKYIEKLRVESPNNANAHMYAINSLKRFVDGKYLGFDDINTNLLVRYQQHENERGVSADTYITKIKTIYNSLKNPRISRSKKEKISKEITLNELRMISTRVFEKKHEFSGSYHFRNYFMLCFYLGGIDFIDLYNLRYDKHVKDGRLNFTRHKGGTNEKVDNIICDQAKYILSLYDCKPYLVPIFKAKSYKIFIDNYNTLFRKQFIKMFGKDSESISHLTSKSPRFTFINIGQNIGIPKDVREQIVGHKRSGTHAGYESGFPQKVIDEAFLKIVNEAI